MAGLWMFENQIFISYVSLAIPNVLPAAARFRLDAMSFS